MTRPLPLLCLLLAACGSPPPATPPPPSDPPPAASSATTAGPAAPATDPAKLAEIEGAIKANNGAQARKLAEAILSKDPKNPKAHYYAALGAELTEDKASAEKHYREALALAPTFGDAAINLSALLLDGGKAAEAVTLLKPLAAKSPDDTLLQTNLATALAAAGDHAQAAEVYAALLKKQPTPEARLGYARALAASGKKEEATKVLREGAAQAGENRDLHAAYGADLAKVGAYEDAIKAMDKAIQLQSSADLLTYRALFKRSLKNNEGARTDLEAALKENPKFAAAHFYLGETLEALNRPGDARKAYEKLIALEPDSPRAKKAQARLEGMKKK
ncbi:MAG: tetratricopeptide repeat protein [Polyangiaceae bacterium]|nr:tetratricopeptide repeat protein [Polyangiaceae bacterium]